MCLLFENWCFKPILCEVAPLESSRDRRLPGRGEFLCVEPSPVSCTMHTLRQQHSLAKTHVNTDTKLVIILKSFFPGTICQWHFTKLCGTDTLLVCLETEESQGASVCSLQAHSGTFCDSSLQAPAALSAFCPQKG